MRVASGAGTWLAPGAAAVNTIGYSLTDPPSGSVFISGLADNPEFIAPL